MGFKEGSAKKLPTLACIGRVQEVGEPKATESGKYFIIPVKIEGYGASRSTRANFMFRKNWFTNGFDPESLLEYEGGNGYYFVYGKNIAQKGSVSLLKGLVGDDDDKFDTLATALQSLPGSETEEGPSATDIAETLRTYLVDEGNGENLGYILRQQRTKAGEDSEGKAKYTLEPYYEISEFGSGDEKWRDRQYKRAERTTNGGFKVGFTEEDAPFN